MVLSARKHATYSHLVVTQFGQDRVSLFSHDHIYIYVYIIVVKQQKWTPHTKKYIFMILHIMFHSFFCQVHRRGQELDAGQ